MILWKLLINYYRNKVLQNIKNKIPGGTALGESESRVQSRLIGEKQWNSAETTSYDHKFETLAFIT